jgi:hypothetical protein
VIHRLIFRSSAKVGAMPWVQCFAVGGRVMRSELDVMDMPVTAQFTPARQGDNLCEANLALAKRRKRAGDGRRTEFTVRDRALVLGVF